MPKQRPLFVLCLLALAGLLTACLSAPEPTVTPLATAIATAAPTDTTAPVPATSTQAPQATDTHPPQASDTQLPLPADTGVPQVTASEAATATETVPPSAASPTAATSELPPQPTYAPEPAWPNGTPPTPFPPPAPIDEAGALTLPTAPPISAFAADLRPEAVGDLAGQEGRSLYQIALRLDPGGQRLLGRERISLTNSQDAPMTRVVLRLYPNFPGTFDERKTPTGFPRLQVGTARVADAPTDVAYLDDNTAVAVSLPQPIKHGERQSIELEFRLSTDGLGPAPDVWFFKSFYPMLAVYRGGEWRMDVTAFPDQVFAESSFYVVDWSAPPNVVLASSGTEIGQTPRGNLTIHHILAGPVREFAATASPRYRQDTRQLPGITIRSTEMMTDTAQATEDLDTAVKALDLYSKLFGPYPFNDFDLLLTTTGSGGIEFPGYVMISHLSDRPHLREFVVAHEVAHQWWYSVVGDDIFREAWLDEAFANYTAYIFAQKSDDQSVADDIFRTFVAGGWPGYSGRVVTADPTIGKRVGSATWEFGDFLEYDGIIYGKGPVFLDRLRGILGDDRFFKLMQTHFVQNKYGITTGRTFLSEAESVAGADAPAVRALYLAWVEGQP
ncbi:MAG: M1 family aminopeptidase [Chloroflexia bacterium]